MCIFKKNSYIIFLFYALLHRRKVPPKLNDFFDDPILFLIDGANISKILRFWSNKVHSLCTQVNTCFTTLNKVIVLIWLHRYF